MFETRKLRRYRLPTWTGDGGGYANTPTEEWDVNTALDGIRRPGYYEEMSHWGHSLLDGKQPEPSLEDAYQNMRVIRGISESIETGQVVHLSAAE